MLARTKGSSVPDVVWTVTVETPTRIRDGDRRVPRHALLRTLTSTRVLPRVRVPVHVLDGS